jgi:3-hydroxyacyl-CoA dehydrogenase
MGAVMRDSVSCARPLLVFALHGQALGGGLELALCGDLRVAARGTRLGFPEIRLGLLPGGGGTQRLPRLIGVKASLDVILSGKPVDAEAALALGLVDEVADGDLVDAAVALARRRAGDPAAFRRLSRSPPPPCEEDFAALRAAALLTSDSPAAGMAVDAVQAATSMAFDEGLAREAELFQEARRSPQSRALRHLFAAERKVASVPGMRPDVVARALDTAAVVGAGTMGVGVCIALADAGLRVTLVDLDQAALDRGLAKVAATYGSLVERGRMTGEERDARLGRIGASLDLGDLAEIDLVVECVFENMDVKRSLFARLGRLAKPRAVLATNTSALDVTAIAEAAGRPADVVGLHFFSPANVMRLVEVVRTPAAADDALATAMLAVRRMGKIGVVAGVCDGFIGNRMIGGYLREAGLLLLEGAAPEQVDGALRRFGMAMGPHAMGDLAGLDIQAAGRARRRAEGKLPADPRIGAVGDALVAAGRLGLKTGRGIYAYEPGSRAPLPDPEVAALIEALAARLGVARRRFDDEEVIDRCILPLVNEGARVLKEGVALGAADIDVVYANGYGFPRSKGGPMFWADAEGLPRVLARIERLHAATGDAFWQPAPLLAELASSGRSFADLPRG